jgi:hypothetical protein
MKPFTGTAALATAAAATVALTGAPGVFAGSSPRTLRVTAKTQTLTAPATAPKAGDHLEFYETTTGDDRGKDYFECAVTNAAGDALCSAQFVLAHGNISLQAVFDVNATTVHVTGPITGGTGRYARARGTFVATGSPTNTHFAFRFR